MRLGADDTSRQPHPAEGGIPGSGMTLDMPNITHESISKKTRQEYDFDMNRVQKSRVDFQKCSASPEVRLQ